MSLKPHQTCVCMDVMNSFMSTQLNTHLHVVFEDVCSSGHVHDVVDDEFAESSEQVPPLVQRLDLVGLVLLVSLCRCTRGSGGNLQRRRRVNEWSHLFFWIS